MRRLITVTLPTKSEKQLATEPCQRFLELQSSIFEINSRIGIELSKGESSQSSKLRLLEKTSDLLEAESSKLYESLTEEQRNAILEKDIVEEINKGIKKRIEFIWAAKGLPNNIVDIASERAFIEILRLRYVYPDYLELVGEPTNDDFYSYTAGNNELITRLTTQRKADLLLLGTFVWKGMPISRAYRSNEYDPKGWLVCVDENHEPFDALGIWFEDFRGKWTKCFPKQRYYPDDLYDLHPYSMMFGLTIRFNSFRSVKAMWLHELLVDCDVELGNRPVSSGKRVKFKDGNPFNCLPDNMTLVSKVGRRMICVSCGRETTKEQSVVVREGQKKLRYCKNCLAR